MAISYNRLWKRLIDHDLSKTDMMHRANISTNVLARLGKGAPVSMESMEKICKVLSTIPRTSMRRFGIKPAMTLAKYQG